MNINDIKSGMKVDVTATQTSGFDDFTGRVQYVLADKEVIKFVIVKDQDDVEWHCFPDQLTPATE